MHRILAVAALSLSLGACATTDWSKITGAVVQVNADTAAAAKFVQDNCPLILALEAAVAVSIPASKQKAATQIIAASVAACSSTVSDIPSAAKAVASAIAAARAAGIKPVGA